jgi:predicted phosphoadenosine phosphosulfate sulfurtransferase
MMHLVCQEARQRGRKVGVLYVDLEAQYKLTIDNVREMFALYADVIEPYWLALPIRMRNAVSNVEPFWIAWDPEKKAAWVRQPEPMSITDPSVFPWFTRPWRDEHGIAHAMEFEELIAEFGKWYGRGEDTACFVGIRSDESLNRWRAVSEDRASREFGLPWTTRRETVVNAYPIYDWTTEDIWTFNGRTGLPYNHVYNMMHKAGLSIHQMRICQPYGDDQRRGLSLFHVIEPDTWVKIVARVSGANQGALYAGKSGNVLGNRTIDRPASHATWQSYAEFLLASMPTHEREHYGAKIAVFLNWYKHRGYSDGIPDEADLKAESNREKPSWRRVCKTILKNDRLCKGLGFSQTSSSPVAYEKYRKVMQKRRAQWGF